MDPLKPGFYFPSHLPPVADSYDKSNRDSVALYQRAVRLEDSTEKVRLLKQAVALGNTDAMASLGWMYQLGRGGLPQDDAEAVRLYRKAADAGNTTRSAHNELEPLPEKASAPTTPIEPSENNPHLLDVEILHPRAIVGYSSIILDTFS